MGFSISVSKLTPIRTYEEADAHFNNTKKPRSHRWSEQYRPLRDTRSTHLALRRGELNGVPYYDCELYQTPLVRYFQPNDKGERAVWLSYHYSLSTSKFMSHMGWWNGQRLVDEQGVVGHNIFASSLSHARMLWGDSFTSKLVLNADGRFLRDKSVHMPVFRRSSTATMRARRKKLKEKFDVMLMLIEMQFNDMVASHELCVEDGEPFANRNRNNRRTNIAHFNTARHIIRDMAIDAEPTDDERTTLARFLTDLARHSVATLMNRRFFTSVVAYEGWRRVYTRNDFTNQATIAEQPADIQEILVPSYKEVCSSVLDSVLDMANLVADARTPYPQFPETAPRTYYGAELTKYLTEDAYHKLANRKGVIY